MSHPRKKTWSIFNHCYLLHFYHFVIYSALRYGRQKLFLWRGMPGDGSLCTSTPHKMMQDVGVDKLSKVFNFIYFCIGGCNSLFIFHCKYPLVSTQIIQRYDQTELPKVKWLDKLSFRKIEKMNQVCTLTGDLPYFKTHYSEYMTCVVCSGIGGRRI